MTELKLEDLSKAELVELFRRVVFGVRQSDLLRVRWDTLTDASHAAGTRACELGAIAAEKAGAFAKTKDARQLPIARAEYLAASDASMKAQAAWDRACAKADEAHAALEQAGG